MYCWEAAKRSQVAITELQLFRKSTGVILRDTLPASQRLCANRAWALSHLLTYWQAWLSKPAAYDLQGHITS